MKLFKRKNSGEPYTVQTARTDSLCSFGLERYTAFAGSQEKLFGQLRATVPVIDAAICKIARLCGGFEVIPEDMRATGELETFTQHVRVGAFGESMESFVASYIEQLLTYGTAVGEIVLNRNADDIAALYNAPLDSLDIKSENDNPFDVKICRRRGVESIPVRYPELILTSVLNPEPGALKGTSILQGLPFISSILMTIYNTIGLNWERVGNVRFAVTCKNNGNDPLEKSLARERAMQIAEQWTRAMENSKSGRVSDFVAVGDVEVKVIGADNQILDSEIPVRQLLEQIVAKLGIPPFLLGFNWSSTERMSTQQADILTTELEAYRRTVEPVIRKICSLYLRMHGYSGACRVEWSPINLLDSVEEARARLYTAQAISAEKEGE